MKLVINNYMCQVVYTYETEAQQKAFDKLVYETINILDPSRFMSPAFKRNYWDGRLKIYDLEKREFPTGLSRYFIDLFNKQKLRFPNMELELDDKRDYPVKTNVPESIQLGNGDEEPITLRDYQKDSVAKAFSKQVGIVNLSTNSGKAIANDENIPMADGTFRKVKDIKVGDYLIGQDGKPTKVLARYPQPIQKLYRVTLSDGREQILSGGHLMPVWKIGYHEGIISKLHAIPLRDMLSNYLRCSKPSNGRVIKASRYSVPMTDPIAYQEQKHTIDPYALGILLAEGSLSSIARSNELVISSNEIDVVEHFMEYSGLTGYTKNAHNYGYSFPKYKNGGIDIIKDAIKSFGLATTTTHKFIPNEYLYDSISNRMKLLQALIDTDGTIIHNKGGSSYQVGFSTSSLQLSKDFKTLVRGLGIGITSYVDNRRANPNYTFTLFTPKQIFTSNKHISIIKDNNLHYKSNKHIAVKIRNIEPIGMGNSTCFTVDNKDHLFLINDYIVTHNTEVASGIIKLAKDAIANNERIWFMCGSKDIAYQSQKRISKRLNGAHIGFWGDGKYDEAQIMVTMVGTVNSALKKPEDSFKLTSNKDKALKKFVTEYYPKLDGIPNIKLLAKSMAKNFKIKYKYDEQVLDMLVQIATSSETNPNKLQKGLEYWNKQYDKLLQKKAGKLYDKYNNAVELLSTVKVCITDECLTGDSLITMNEGTHKRLKSIEIGDILYGDNKVTHTKITDKQPVVKIKHRFGMLKGSETHPMAILENDDIVYKPTMLLKEGDKLVLPKMENSKINSYFMDLSDEDLIAQFVGLIIADGHILTNKSKGQGVHRSNTVRVNVSKDFEWYRKVYKSGIKAIERAIDKEIPVDDKLDSRGNLILRSTDKDLLDYLDRFEIPAGKKSDTIKTPKLYQGNNRLLANMYLGVISCEGDLSVSDLGSARLNFNMCSESFMLDAQAWLIAQGFESTFNYTIKHGKHSTCYRITIGGKDLNEFSSQFPIIERKRNIGNKGLNEHSHYADMLVSPIKKIIRDDEEDTLYDLTTENHTFIANGVLTHNCHHATANTYVHVYENMPNARMRIGLTGTVDKKDPVQWWKLQANFTDVISEVRNDEMIKRGVSAKPTVKLLPVEFPPDPKLAQLATATLSPDLPPAQRSLAEYQFIYKEGIIYNDYRNEMIVTLAKNLVGQEGTTLIVVNSVEHGEIIQSKLEEAGVTSAFLQGANSTDERSVILNGVKDGSVKTLIGTQLIDEGIDLPNLSYLLYTAGGKSPRQLLQRVGRVLRVSDTKKTATIIDFQDKTHRVFGKQSDARKRIYLDEKFVVEDV